MAGSEVSSSSAGLLGASEDTKDPSSVPPASPCDSRWHLFPSIAGVEGADAPACPSTPDGYLASAYGAGYSRSWHPRPVSSAAPEDGSLLTDQRLHRPQESELDPWGALVILPWDSVRHPGPVSQAPHSA